MIELDEVLDLFNGYFIVYNYVTYEVQYIQQGKAILAKNISFEECMELLSKEKIVKTEEFDVEDLDFFITNPYIQGSFLFPFTKENGSNQYYRVVKRIKNGNAFIYLEEFNDENSLSTLTDPLTDVYQRDVIEQFVNNKISLSNDKGFYMLVVDIDNFKSYNDKYGHLTGDKVLKEFSKVLKSMYNDGFIGRVGGDEFVIVDFSTIDKKAIEDKSDLLLKNVSKISVDGVKEKLSITIGISFYPEYKDYRSLFAQADKNLYKGKYTGKNKFVF